MVPGIDVQLFEPLQEAQQDFYAERPIAIRMLGNYHEFGDFVDANDPRTLARLLERAGLPRNGKGLPLSVPDFLAQQTGADPDFYFFIHTAPFAVTDIYVRA